MFTCRRISRVVIGMGCSLLVALALFFIGGYIVVLVVLSQADRGFMMPQDCPGVGVLVSGKVVDVHRKPIAGAEVSVKQLGLFSHPDEQLIDLTFTTDAHGQFSVETSFHHLLCDALVFEIVAANYHDNSFWYFLRDYYTEAEIEIIAPNITNVEIMLLRAVP